MRIPDVHFQNCSNIGFNFSCSILLFFFIFKGGPHLGPLNTPLWLLTSFLLYLSAINKTAHIEDMTNKQCEITTRNRIKTLSLHKM